MCGFVGFMDKLNQDEKRKSIKVMADRIIQVKSGKIEQDLINERPIPVENIEW